MKKILLALWMIWATVLLAGCDLPKNVVNYNNEIISIQESMVTSYTDLLNQVWWSWTLTGLNDSYNSFLSVLSVAKEKIVTITWYKWDNSFSDAIKHYVNTFDSLAQNEMKDAVALLNKDEDKLTPEDEANYDSVVTAIDAKTEKNDSNFISAQASFVKKYDMQLEWEETTK